MRVFSYLCIAAAACAACAPGIAGQWPAEVRGVVEDRGSGRGLSGALVAADDGTTAVSDVDGRFLLVGVTPGGRTLRVTALGYESRSLPVEVKNGRVHDLRIALVPSPLVLEGLRATVDRPAARAVTLDREDLRNVGARSLGDALSGVPGVSLRTDRDGGRQTVSIRGSDAHAVLVLIDGVPLNDPLTGEADLASIDVASVESVTVYRGAESSRFGSGATAGAIVVRTGGWAKGWEGRIGRGSLGLWRGGGVVARRLGTWSVSSRFGLRTLDGGFDFDQPAVVGGGRGTQDNADARLISGSISADRSTSIGALRLRLGFEDDRRGLPGRSVAPSPTARSEARRLRLSGGWSRGWSGGDVELTAYGSLDRSRVRDPRPPLGLPYDARVRLEGGGARIQATRRLGHRFLESVTVRGETRSMWVDADALSDSGPDRRTDATLGVHAAVWPIGDSSLRLHLGGAVHRDPARGGSRLTHDVALDGGAGPLKWKLAHRSAFRPPSLADQFFREGVGIAPNPSLRAERIPSELEVTLEGDGSVGRWRWSAGLAAWQGDVRDRIVWAPDFRFVWGPRNTDVRRRGLGTWATVDRSVSGFRIEGRASYDLNDVTYDRTPSSQLAYRPKHSGAVAVAVEGGGWRANVDAVWTGARYPVPSPVNELPGFVTADLGLTHGFRLGSGTADVEMRIRRLFDRTDTLIFGYPHPGRTIDLTLRVHGGSP